MRKVLLIVAPTLLVYLLLTFFTGNLFGIQGTRLWVLRGALWLIGIVAAAVVAWFFWDKQKKEKSAAAAGDEAPTGGEEIAVLMRDAEKKLSAAQLAKGARIGNLPAILLLGETSSTKTSTMLHSGLEPELLAGQIYEHGNVTSTRSANLWYSQQTIFVEAGGKLHRQRETCNGANQEPPGPGVLSFTDVLRGRLPSGRQPREIAADPLDLPGRGAHDGLQFPAVADAVTAAIPQQKAKIVNLQYVRQILGVAAPQQFLQVLKEDLAGHVRTEQFFLQWLAGPVGEQRTL